MPYVVIGEATRTVTTSTTLAVSDQVVLVDATAGAVTITLPPSAQMPGRRVRVKKIDASTNAVTVQASAGDSIDTAVSLAAQGDTTELYLPPGATVWRQIGGGMPQWTKAQTTWAPGTLLAGQVARTTVSVSGTQVGQPAVAGHTGISDPAVVLSAAVTSAGTVTVAAINLTGAAVTVPSGTLTVAVLTR